VGFETNLVSRPADFEVWVVTPSWATALCVFRPCLCERLWLLRIAPIYTGNFFKKGLNVQHIVKKSPVNPLVCGLIVMNAKRCG
jgi:hypothetical protein